FSRDWSSDVCSSDLEDIRCQAPHLIDECRRVQDKDPAVPEVRPSLEIALGRRGIRLLDKGIHGPRVASALAQSRARTDIAVACEIGRASCRGRVEID